MIADLFAGWRFALRRLTAGWRFMLVAGLGMLVAATLLAMTPIYASAMSDLGLRFRLDRELATPQQRLAEVLVPAQLMGDPVDRARRDAVDAVDRVVAELELLGDRVVAPARQPRRGPRVPPRAEQVLLGRDGDP